MKVRCVKLLDWQKKPVDRSAWAKIGGIYHVLSLWIEPGQTGLRLIGEEPTPTLFEPEMFEVVSSIIPDTWVITSPKPGCLSLAPAAWNTPGFWERYFDREPDAVACFEQCRAKIVAADP
jgi:hypothetical protein